METKRVTAKNLVDFIIRYENGELTAYGVLCLFAYLLKTGQCWSLQGHYGRTAQGLISQGYLDREGNIIRIDI